MPGHRTPDEICEKMESDLKFLHEIDPGRVHDFLLEMIHEYTPAQRDRTLDIEPLDEIQ